MSNRLLRWFILNILFALTPLLSAIIIRLIANKLTIQDMANNYLEVIFFSFMISVTTIGDLEELEIQVQRSSLVYVIKQFLFVTSFWLSLLYGASLLDSIVGLNLEGFRYNMFRVATAISLIIFLVGFITQIYITKTLQRIMRMGK